MMEGWVGESANLADSMRDQGIMRSSLKVWGYMRVEEEREQIPAVVYSRLQNQLPRLCTAAETFTPDVD